MGATETVRRMFEAYLAQDADTARALLADDFTFTSPQDDHIDRDAFMDRCFPTVQRVLTQEILRLADDGGGAGACSSCTSTCSARRASAIATPSTSSCATGSWWRRTCSSAVATTEPSAARRSRR